MFINPKFIIVLNLVETPFGSDMSALGVAMEAMIVAAVGAVDSSCCGHLEAQVKAQAEQLDAQQKQIAYLTSLVETLAQKQSTDARTSVDNVTPQGWGVSPSPC